MLFQIPEAMKVIREALQLQSDHLHSLHLLALLLSASHQAAEALQLMEAALEEYPNNFKWVASQLEYTGRPAWSGHCFVDSTFN